MSKITVAIIGAGPRGLSIIERLTALYHNFPDTGNIDVLLIDPNLPGMGVHGIQQPDHLLVNTVACQITLFGDETIKNVGPIRTGPNFYQWVIKQGYRNLGGAFIQASPSEGEEINENDYLPRRLLGEYLAWGYQEFTRTLPPGMHIQEIRQRSVDLCIHDNGKTDIILAGGERYSADFIYLTTGHSKNMKSLDDHHLQFFTVTNRLKNGLLHYYADPYPVSVLDNISPEARVLVQGIGLTAYDVLSQLTYGRGGSFKKADGRLRYIASGREPRVSIFSRHALPFSSRAQNQKGISEQYKPSFFTFDKLRDIRMQNTMAEGSPKLDFETQVLPLLLKEMSYVYRCTLDGCWHDAELYKATNEDTQIIEALLYPHRDTTFSSLNHYTKFFIAHLEKDLQAAKSGNVKGPVKAATDVLRDVRDILRAAIDFGGLTAASHKRFIEHFTPIFNRISVGPPMQRNLELQALMDAGIVTLAGGPSSTLVLNSRTGHFEVHTKFTNEQCIIKGDVLIKAKIDHFSILEDETPLIRNLVAQGIFRPFINEEYHVGGIDIDQKQHPINSKGQVLNTIWILGNPAEGPNFYTYVLARPRVNSRLIQDAGRCVIDMYQQLQCRYSANSRLAHAY